MRRRVVVTGIGAINPMGHDVETVWKGLQEGESGVGYTTVFDASNFPTKISAEVKDWDVTTIGEPAERWEFRGRHSHFAAGAAHQAVNSSGILDTALDPTRFGVYLGSGEGNQDFNSFSKMMTAAVKGGDFDVAEFTRAGLEILNPSVELEQEPNMPAAHLALIKRMRQIWMIGKT